MTPARRRALWRQVGERIASGRESSVCSALYYLPSVSRGTYDAEIRRFAHVFADAASRRASFAFRRPLWNRWWSSDDEGCAHRLIACAWMIATAGEEW